MQLAKVKAKYKVREQGMLYFSLKRLAKQGGVPPYKSWSYLMRNEQANETGGRVFYTDSTGAALQPCSCMSRDHQVCWRTHHSPGSV